MKQYLTSQGLQTLWNQIKALFATKAELNQKANKTELNTLSESVSASLSEIEQTDIRQDASISSLSENKADKTELNKLSTDTTTALDKKVDKVSGMGLSHNDYTDEDKAKLDGIEANANDYSLPVAGSELGGVKNGGDIAIQSDGTMQVNDDSHNHIISNVDGLQSALNGKRTLYEKVFAKNSVIKAQSTEGLFSAIFTIKGMYTDEFGAYFYSRYYYKWGYGYKLIELSKCQTCNIYLLDGDSLIFENKSTSNLRLGVITTTSNNLTISDLDSVPEDAVSPEISYVNNAISDRIGNIIDETYATKTENNNKVDKVSGKGLSTNDYTTAEKNKLAGVAAGAEVNTIVAVQRNGTAITPANRVVNILVPVKTSELNNDSTYQTAADVAETIVGVKLDLASGIITLTRKNGTTFTLDLPTEKIIKSGRYDSETEEIVLVLEDESEIRFSASELIDEYYADESTLELYTDTADGNKKKFRIKTAYKNKIDGSEQTTNKTASVSASSTETQYPNAKAVYNAVKDLATKVQTFTQATTRANIESGETISVIFGKIKKWLADLKTVAFSGSYNDLSDTPELPTIATSTKAGLVKSGGDITVASDGVVSVNDNSHNHSAANITTGTFPIERGGTGGTTRRMAEFNLLGSDDSLIDDSIIDDDRRFALLNLGISAENGAFRWMTFSGVWTYIQTKIKDVLGLTATNYNGTAAKATADGSGNNISSTYATKAELSRKISKTVGYCVTDIATPYWFLIAEYTCTSEWFDLNTTFIASRNFYGGQAILQASIRTNTMGKIEICELKCLSKDNLFSTDCFAIAYKGTAGSKAEFQIWAKCPSQYHSMAIMPIYFGTRTLVSNAKEYWTLRQVNETYSELRADVRADGLFNHPTGFSISLCQVPEYRTLSGVLELTDSNLATYFNSSTGVLTIPKGVTTVIFNTTAVKTVYLVKGTVQTNGYRLTIGGKWQPDTNSDYQGLEGCFPHYVDYHYYGYTGSSLPNFDAYSHFADYVYFNGMWYSKMY